MRTSQCCGEPFIYSTTAAVFEDYDSGLVGKPSCETKSATEKFLLRLVFWQAPAARLANIKTRLCYKRATALLLYNLVQSLG